MTTELAERRRRVEVALRDLRSSIDREFGALLAELLEIERLEREAERAQAREPCRTG